MCEPPPVAGSRTANLISVARRIWGRKGPPLQTLREALEIEDDSEGFVEPEVGFALTQVLDGARAKSLLLSITKADQGLVAVLLGEQCPGDGYFREWFKAAEEAFRAEPEAFREDAEAIAKVCAHYRERCEWLSAQLGGDLDQKLDRIAPWSIDESEDEVLEPTLLDVPTDRAARFADGLAERAAFVKQAKRDHPGMLVRLDPLQTYDLESTMEEINPGRCRVAVLDCDAALLPLYCNVGCGPYELHARVWRRWGERYGARPVFLSCDTIEGYVARPPTTVEEHIAFFAEQTVYNPDTRADQMLGDFAQAFGNAHVRFWWD